MSVLTAAEQAELGRLLRKLGKGRSSGLPLSPAVIDDALPEGEAV
jgi:hypothetical protein